MEIFEPVWENVASWCLTLFVVACITLGMYAVSAPHVVDDYYASGHCVWAHWTWRWDDKVWCSDEAPLLLEVLRQLKATVHDRPILTIPVPVVPEVRPGGLTFERNKFIPNQN